MRILTHAVLAVSAALSVVTPIAYHAITTHPTVQAAAPCATEDSPGPCFWDAQTRGNHLGHSFIRPATPAVNPDMFRFTGIEGKGWVTVSKRDARVLRGSDFKGAEHRNWTHCVSNGASIFCPGGHAFRWDNGWEL
jgi:hypothetical protein